MQTCPIHNSLAVSENYSMLVQADACLFVMLFIREYLISWRTAGFETFMVLQSGHLKLVKPSRPMGTPNNSFLA